MNETVIEHALSRLQDIGIRDVFGIAGDFSFPIDDAIVNSNAMRWVGSCNELNAAYSADGYARNRIRGRDGQIYSTGVSEGRTVVDLLPQDLDSLLNGPEGKNWANANPGLAVSMLAPDGVCSYSHDGVEFKVGDNGLVLVADYVANALRSHGFRAATGS